MARLSEQAATIARNLLGMELALSYRPGLGAGPELCRGAPAAAAPTTGKWGRRRWVRIGPSWAFG